MAARYHPYERTAKGAPFQATHPQQIAGHHMPHMTPNHHVVPNRMAPQLMPQQQFIPQAPSYDPMSLAGYPAAPVQQWETHWSDDGRPYYFNLFTQQSTWEPPPEVLAMYMPTNTSTQSGGPTGFANPHGGGGGKAPPAALVNGKHPVRPGQPDCSFFVNSGMCKFGEGCKFNHPPEKTARPAVGLVNGKHPIRPEKPICTYWTSKGDCKYGPDCTFNHPPEQAVASLAKSLTIEPVPPEGSAPSNSGGEGPPHTTPSRTECTFFKTGTCKYGASCKFNHSSKDAIPSIGAPRGDGGAAAAAAAMQAMHAMPEMMSSIGPAFPSPFPLGGLDGLVQPWEVPAWNMMMAMSSQMAAGPHTYPSPSTYQTDPRAPPAGFVNGKHPIRPGQPDCSFFVSSGMCKYGEACKFNHPPEKVARPAAGMVNGKHPIRPEKPTCVYWIKAGDCKFGPDCTFNHPPEGANVALASAIAGSIQAGLAQQAAS